MSLNRHAARRDDNEPAIVEGLMKFGAKVERLKWPCDLLVRWRQKNYLIEVSNPANKYRKREKAQVETLEKFEIPIVTTLEEALLVIGAEF